MKLQDIPEAREWRVGSTYMLLVGVKMDSIVENKHRAEAGFEVIKVKSVDIKTKKQ